MKLLNVVLLAASVLLVEAGQPALITALAKRANCFSLPVGPSDTGVDSSLTITKSPVAAAAATPTCQHAADPHGDMGLCSDLSKNGWCDCGKTGTFSVLNGDNVCGYTTQPPSSATVSMTGCSSAPHATTHPPAPPSPKCPSGTVVDCKDCPNGHEKCTNIGFTGFEALCQCKSPCGSVSCVANAI